MSQSISSCYGFSLCLIYGIMDWPALIVEKLHNFFFSPYGSHLSERALSNINNMLWKKGAESITSSGIGSLEAWCPSHPCPSHRQKKERKKDWCKLSASQSTHTSLENACKTGPENSAPLFVCSAYWTQAIRTWQQWGKHLLIYHTTQLIQSTRH